VRKNKYKINLIKRAIREYKKKYSGETPTVAQLKKYMNRDMRTTTGKKMKYTLNSAQLSQMMRTNPKHFKKLSGGETYCERKGYFNDVYMWDVREDGRKQ